MQTRPPLLLRGDSGGGLRVCVCINLYICICAYRQTYLNTYICVDTYMHMDIHMTCTHTYLYIYITDLRTGACTLAAAGWRWRRATDANRGRVAKGAVAGAKAFCRWWSSYSCKCGYICMYVCIYTCVCIYIYIYM